MGDDLRAFAEAWRAMPKWVVSRSLKSVGPNATLIGDDVEAAVRKLKADLVGEIEVGGPKLAAILTKLGLIDEYQLFLHPVVLGLGRPFFVGPQPRLRLVASASRQLDSDTHPRRSNRRNPVTETALCFDTGCHRLWKRHLDASPITRENLIAAEVAAIGNGLQLIDAKNILRL
jgi:hypothetical protein